MTLPLTPNIAASLGAIESRLAVIEITVKRVEVCLYGNGKPGLSDEHKRLEVMVLEHHKRQEEDRIRTAEEAKTAKELLAEETKAARELLAVNTQAERELLAQKVKDEKEAKDKISSRAWAVGMAVFVAFLGVIAGQVMLYLQLLRTP